jgi:hypothetical protein
VDLLSQIQEKIYVGTMWKKIIVLARELDLQNEFDEMKFKFNSRTLTWRKCRWFLDKIKEFDPIYDKIKQIKTKSRFAIHGELSGDLQNDKGILEVKLVSVLDTALGGLKDLILSSKFTPNHRRPFNSRRRRRICR